MDEVFCKVCGYRGAAGQMECPECGAPLKKAAAPAAEPPKDAAEVNIILKPKERRSHPIRRVAVFLVLCFVIQSLGLWGLGRLEDWDYLESGGNWSGLYNGDFVTPFGVWELDDWVIDMGSSAGPRRVLRSMAALLSSQYPPPEDAPYYYDGETLRRTGWSWGALSGDGKVLFYAQQEGEDQALYRQEGRQGLPQELDRVPGDAAARMLVTYDGSAVVYVVGAWKGGDPVLRQWSQKTGVTELDFQEGLNLLRLGRNGTNRLRIIGSDGGEVEFHVEWGERGRESVFPSSGAFVVDRDLTEVLAQSDDGMVIYENEAGERRTVEGFPAGWYFWPLRAGGPGTYTDRYGLAVERLTDWVYQSQDDRLYYLSEDLSVTELTGEWTVKDCVISDDGRSVYCLSKLGELYRLERTGGRWSTQKIGEDWWTEGITAAQDLSLLDGKDVTLGVKRYAHILLDTATGETRTVEHSHIGWEGCLLNGGGCWYLDGDALWYWHRETGTAEWKLSLDDLGGDAAPEGGWDFALEVVGDGSQALLIRQPMAEDVVLGGALNGGLSEGYWLLTAGGEAEELETLSLSE